MTRANFSASTSSPSGRRLKARARSSSRSSPSSPSLSMSTSERKGAGGGRLATSALSLPMKLARREGDEEEPPRLWPPPLRPPERAARRRARTSFADGATELPLAVPLGPPRARPGPNACGGSFISTLGAPLVGIHCYTGFTSSVQRMSWVGVYIFSFIYSYY